MLSGALSMKKLLCILFGLTFLISPDILSAQTSKIELVSANSLKFDKKLGVDAQRLIGNVIFKHKGAMMYCDSAYLYNADNSLDAFGHVRVIQGDTLNLKSEKLFYNGNTQYVKVRDKVTLNDQSMSLKTNTLDYDRKTGQAIFFDRGTITSTENQNKLVACEGVYDSPNSFFYFRDSVVLNNPKYRVETDTLNYSNLSEIAYFKGPTYIFSDANTIYCENGWYDTKKDISQFNENAYLDNGNQILKGDSLWYDRDKGLGRAYDNVSIIDTTEQVIINGNLGKYFEKTGKTLVTDRAEMVQYDALDSLFLHGDTLLAVEDSVRGDRIYAYHNVRFYRSDIQGVADSLVFSQSDSLIHMYTDPVLWADDLQITGDTIEIKTAQGRIENLFVFENAFMANRVDSVKYNQIKGKRLTGYFRDNDLYKVLIEGNGQSLYYAAEEEKAEPEITDTAAVSLTRTDDSLAVKSKPEIKRKYIGVNKSICSNILIYLNNNQVKQIVFLKKPDGTFFPIHKFPEEERYYDGFDWKGNRRPVSHADIFRKVKSPKPENTSENPPEISRPENEIRQVDK